MLKHLYFLITDIFFRFFSPLVVVTKYIGNSGAKQSDHLRNVPRMQTFRFIFGTKSKTSSGIEAKKEEAYQSFKKRLLPNHRTLPSPPRQLLACGELTPSLGR